MKPLLPSLHFAVDLDNTLAATEAVFRKAIGETLDRWYDAESLIDYDIQRNYRLSDAEMAKVLARFHQPDAWLDIAPLAGSVDFVAALRQTHRVTLLTARPAMLREVTVQWLDRHGFRLDAVEFADKDAVLAHPVLAGRFDAFVEDHPQFSVAMAAAGRPVFLHDQPWNRTCRHPNLVRFTDYRRVLTHPTVIGRL